MLSQIESDLSPKYIKLEQDSRIGRCHRLVENVPPSKYVPYNRNVRRIKHRLAKGPSIMDNLISKNIAELKLCQSSKSIGPGQYQTVNTTSELAVQMHVTEKKVMDDEAIEFDANENILGDLDAKSTCVSHSVEEIIDQTQAQAKPVLTLPITETDEVAESLQESHVETQDKTIDDAEWPLGTIVWARLAGFPYWPAFVYPEDDDEKQAGTIIFYSIL